MWFGVCLSNFWWHIIFARCDAMRCLVSVYLVVFATTMPFYDLKESATHSEIRAKVIECRLHRHSMVALAFFVSRLSFHFICPENSEWNNFRIKRCFTTEFVGVEWKRIAKRKRKRKKTTDENMLFYFTNISAKHSHEIWCWIFPFNAAPNEIGFRFFYWKTLM